MKLRINTKLRAALIAAISAVGFTLPQTYGTVSWNGGNTGGDWFYTDSGKTGSVLTDDEHGQVNITAEGSNPVTAGISEVTVKDGATVRISGGNFWGQDRTFAALTIDDITAGNGTGSILLSTQPYAAGKAPENTTATVKAVTGTLTGVQNYGVLTLGVDGASSFGLTGAIVNNAGTVTLNGTYSFDTSNANNYALRQEGSATWTDVTNQQGFKKTSGSSYYIIKGATAGTGFQATTTTGDIVTGEEGGNYYFTAGDVTDTTKFYVKTDAVTLEGVTGTGVFQVDHAGATVTVQDATYRVTSGNMNVNIVINDKGVLETTHSGVNGFITGALTINAGGIMRIVGEHDAFGWGSKNQCVASLTMKGEEGKLATLELNQSTGNSATMVTDINMQGYSTITSTKQGGSAGFNTFGCNITASGVQNNIDVLDVRRNGVTIDVANGGELTVGKLTINGSDHSASSVVVKQGEGTLHFTGETKAEGLNIQAGTVDISGTGELHALIIGTDGSLSITGGSTTVTGNGNVLSNTIAVTAGTLTLSGKYEIGGNTGTMATTYEGGVSSTDNGFAHTAGSATVYTKAGDATVNVDNATFTVGGTNVDVVNGVYTTEGSTNYGTFYVKSGTESLAHAIQYASEREHTVNTIAVTGTSTITMDQDGASIGLTLAAGASGTLDTTAAATLTSVSGAGTLVKAGAETLTITGANTAFTGDVTISEGTLKIGNQRALGEHNNGASQTKTITIAEGGTLDLNGVTDANFKYTMAGGTLTNSGAALGYGSSQTTGLDLTADSTVHADNGHDLRLLARGYDPTALNLNSKTLVKTGDGLFALKNTTVSAGTIEVRGGEVNFEVDPQKGGSTAANVILAGGNVSGTMNVSANITIDAQETTSTGVGLNMNSHDLTLNVAEGKELSLTGSITNGASYTKNGEGTLNLGELGLTSGSFAVNAGTVNLESATKTGTGAYTLSGDGTVKIGLYGIDLQAGTLNMSGKYDISDVYVDGEYSYEGGHYEGNGFAVMDGDALVVTIQEGATLATTGATFTWNGQVVTVDEATGTAAVNGKNYSTFYIFTESETVTTAKDMEGSHGALSAIEVEEDGTLEVDQDISADLIGTYSAGTINIQGDKTVTAATGARYFTLDGEGTYDLGSATTLGSVALADDWMGTVKISNNGNATNLNLASLGHADSTVELDGVTGWLSNDGLLVNATVKLSGDGLTVNNGSSNKTIEFAGGVKGEGDFVYTMANGANNQTYIFSGDVSEWNGSYTASGSGKTSTLKFYDEATEVNADIELNAGTLNLVVGNGTDEFTTVFHGEVTASAITVNEHASAEFDNVNLLAAVVNHGDVTINYATLGDAFSQQGGGIAHYGLDGDITQGDNYYIGESEAFVQVVNGGTSTGSVTWQDQSYDLKSDGRIIVREGDVDYSTFYVNDGTVKISDIANSGHETTTVEVASGTLDVDQAGSGIEITVTGMATVTGEGLDASDVGIASESIVNFGESLELDGVKFSSDSIGVAVYNEGDDDAYSLDNTSMVVSATGITKTIGEDVTVSNWLTVEEITNVQGGKLTLNGMEDAVEVANITVGPDSAVEILSAPETEATITVTEELAAGGGTLLANLVMADDSALLVQGVEQALHVGSTLTMGQNIALDGTTLRKLDDLAVGDYFWLIDAAAGRELSYTGDYGEDAWYDSVFSRTAADGDYELQGDFNIVFSEVDGFGLQKFSNVPEPTTGTLSLLALAALAARRRRK
ncbi:MAG: autotransporter-associated beta strand repeat-containing protein [Akkermansia sp.]|nr:autotransporter-associated beta strand repeat-containing protein [Akkermansia sp.]